MSRAGRHYAAEEWVEWLVDGVADSEDVDPDDLDIYDDELQAEVQRYKDAVEKAVESCSKQFPPAVDIVVDDGTYIDLYHTLDGSGVGIDDGRWSHYYPDLDDAEWQKIIACYGRHLGSFVDESGGGSLSWAIYSLVMSEKDDEDDDDDDEIVSTAGELEMMLDAINEYRRQLWMAPLDPASSGYTPDDIREEYLRLRHTNPAGPRARCLRW